MWEWREETAEGFWDQARKVLEHNGVMAVPTETFYALAVHPFHTEALARLFALKDRAPEKPVLVMVDKPEMLNQVAREVPELARRLMDKFWPGPLSLILPSLPHLPRLLTGGTGTIAVRQPRQAITCRLITALGFPITGTSANRAGGRPGIRAEEVAREFGAHLDLVLAAGPCPGGLPSTIVDVTGAMPRLVRAGAIPAAEVAEIMPELERIPVRGASGA